jgi:preprotein translocase subunit SecG
MSILMPILVTLHVIVCLMLVLVVLMQRPRSEGLGSAFGGGITDNVFGSQTTNVLARFTTWMAIGFFGITLLLSILTAKMQGGKTEIQKKLLSEPTPVATPIKNAEDSTPAMGLQNALETPQETPTSTPTEAPAATPAETPASTPEVTAIAPVEVPAAIPAATPEAPVEAPAATPLN